jgi:hypothetical protein
MAKNTAQLTVAEYQALIAGIPKYSPNAIFTVASQTFTAAQAVTFLQTLHDSSAATVAAKPAWKQSVASDEALEAQNGVMAREMRDTVALMFSNAAGTLQAFALAPRKPRTPSSRRAPGTPRPERARAGEDSASNPSSPAARRPQHRSGRSPPPPSPSARRRSARPRARGANASTGSTLRSAQLRRRGYAPAISTGCAPPDLAQTGHAVSRDTACCPPTVRHARTREGENPHSPPRIEWDARTAGRPRPADVPPRQPLPPPTSRKPTLIRQSTGWHSICS